MGTAEKPDQTANSHSQDPWASRPWLAKFVDVRAEEVLALGASFVMFFLVLAAYYIIRPVRDAMGVTIGPDVLHRLFTAVFFVMLASVPIFGFVSSKYPRDRVLPTFYAFFAANLIVFWAVLRGGAPSVVVASTFFIWASVFNLIVISLFWSLMAELWTNGEAKRLYGFISAGGTAGALAGPLVSKLLVQSFAPADLLLIAAALLGLALMASLGLRAVRSGHSEAAMKPAGGSIFDGAKQVVATPFLARIAIFIFLANVAGTFFYLEQSRLVAQTFNADAGRVDFFASRDLLVSLATLTIEIFGTAAALRVFGIGAAILALPVAAAAGTIALSLKPLLLVAAASMVVERVIAFSLSGPAIKVLYTLVTPAEKYKAQNFIDTVVYRGGDAVSGWIFAFVGGGLGFASAATPLIALPLTGLWIYAARELGREHDLRVASVRESGDPG